MAHNEKSSVKFHRDRSDDVRYPKLTKGLHTGVVVGTLEPNKLILVKPDGKHDAVNCIWAASVVSSLLGFKTTYTPPPKTRVLFFYTEAQVSYILGSYSNTVPVGGLDRGVTDHNGSPIENQATFSKQRDPGSRMATAQNPPVDLVEGELNIDNLMGVGITLLRHLASLQAGDLAKVECHLLDDMVRVISRTFKHHSAFGDFQIVNDGGHLNVEWNGTSHDYEAWGNLKPGDVKATLDAKGDQVDMTKVDGYLDEGRWRFSQYIGWLGDFVNMFVTDPVNTIGRLAADQLRSGKARVHVNNDGTILMQSVSDIVLEKVVRIPVPIRLRRDEDPKGNRSDQGLSNVQQLAQWAPSDDQNVFEMAFQLREYARWLNNTHSFSRFRQMNLDFKVPSEQDTPTPDLNGGEEDKTQVNAGIVNTRLAYACFRIYRDGSVQTVDAYGNSILSTATGIQISSTTDILIQAAGSVNIVAGRDFNVVAHEEIGITSVMQKIRLVARLGIHNFISGVGNFLWECATTGTAFFNRMGINVNNQMSVDVAGEINTNTTITAVEISAATTMPEDDHMGHLFPGFPVVTPATDEFQYPETYDGLNPGDPDTKLYQTYAQSTLDPLRREQPTKLADRVKYFLWSIAENFTSKGFPWPGSPGVLEKKVITGANLNTPTGTVPGAAPRPMIPEPPAIMRKVV